MSYPSITEMTSYSTVLVYFTKEFRNVLESYIPVLKKSTNTSTIAVDTNLPYRYEYDFYGLLSYLKIPPQYHWVVMRLNDVKSPQEYSGDLTSLLVPDYSYIERLRQIHSSSLVS